MDRREKVEMLQKLSEKELTKTFLIPLYESEGMGCKNVEYTHGILEGGKDIIYYKDDEYGNRIYTGVQVKKTKITAGSVDKIFRQICEAFGKQFTDNDGQGRYLNRFVVLTSDDFTDSAKGTLWSALRGTNLDKFVNMVDRNKLVPLLDKHCPSVFQEDYESILRKFKEMLSKSDITEKKIKQFFIENPWLVGVGYNYANIVPDEESREHPRVDLSLETFEHDYDIMILKHHMDPIISSSGGEWKLSEECEISISQLYRYFEWYVKAVKSEDYRLKHEVYEPKGFVVIGQNTSIEIQRKLKLINRYFSSIELLTYDELYEQAERWIKVKTQEREKWAKKRN